MLHLSTTVEIAATLRGQAGLFAPPFSTTALVARCFPSARVTGRALPSSVEEIVTKTSAGPLIVYRRGITVPEQRFAIAHAIGHLVYDIDNDADAAGIGTVGNPRCELRADTLAAELLVPLSELAKHVRCWPTTSRLESGAREEYLDQVDRLAGLFNVPQQLIRQRIRRLECLTKRHGELV